MTAHPTETAAADVAISSRPPNATAPTPDAAIALGRWARLRRRAAAGKALIVYLFSGSLGLAILAFLVFKGLHC